MTYIKFLHQSEERRRLMFRKAITILTAAAMTLSLGIGLCACGSEPQTATITIDSNQTTGYAWTATQTIKDNAGESHCFEISDEYVEPEDTGGMVGVPGQQVFTLKAVEAGDVDVSLTYSRSWEPSKDDDQVVYHFSVDKNLQIEYTGCSIAMSTDGSILDIYDTAPEPVIQ